MSEHTRTVEPGTETEALRAELARTVRRLREAEKLNRLHPDTGLPIYRFLLQDIDTLIQAIVTGQSGEAPRLSEASGCAAQFAESGVPEEFHIFQIRLDDQYLRIRNTRDRSKALLFKSTYRIGTAIDRGCLYQSDRLDEFFLLYPGPASSAQIARLCHDINRVVSEPHDPPAEDIRFGARVSVTSYPADALSSETLLANGEIAMAEAEKADLRFCHYTEELGRKYRYLRQVEQELSRAMQKGFNQFSLVFQPICDADGHIRGAEALIRWDHPTLGRISPGVFIPIAESNGSIRLLGKWVLFRTGSMVREWRESGLPAVELAINLSPVQFLQQDLVESIVNVVQTNKLPPGAIKLEITEGAFMMNPAVAIAKMTELRNAGFHLAIDDFGTGYSSLSYLRSLPVNVLKIDKSFVDDLTRNTPNQAIVRAIIALAKNLNLVTLAEGVEYEEQVDFLHREGVDLIQGYFYSPPVDAETFRGYLETGGSLPL